MKKKDISEELIKDYLQGVKLQDLGKKYKIGITSIRTKLTDLNIFKKDVSRSFRYSINDGYFEKIDTEDKAYFLGLLYADGYNIKVGVGIDLASDDIEILKTFNNFLKNTKPLKIYKSKNEKHKDKCRLFITNVKIKKDLEKLGLVNNKTHVLKFPTEEQVPKHLIQHFIRGYFDGDGCITKSSPRNFAFSFTGNKPLIDGIKDYILKNTTVNKLTQLKRHKDRKDSIITIMGGSNIICMKFYFCIYNNSNIFFKRKKKKFEECFELIKSIDYKKRKFYQYKEIKKLIQSIERI